jgi:RNA polymerase sigma-70 factor (ECF subfamily)
MKPDDFDQRLSRITTLWTLHVRAHSPDAAAAARAELLYRYRAAAYRYVLAAVRDADAADDLAQDFAVRFLRGDFRSADPGRGRFRDYLRTSLRHLVTDHQRAKKQAAAPLAVEPAAPEDADTTFHAAWREELMERTWQRLAEEQPTGHAALRMRVEDPELTSAQMAERLAEKLGRAQTAEGVRKALQRAHERFAEVLLDEVAATLEGPTVADLEAELQELGLTRYCRTALARWGK